MIMKTYFSLIMLMLSVLGRAQDTLSTTKFGFYADLGIIFNTVGVDQGGITGYQIEVSTYYSVADRMHIGLGSGFDNYFPSAGESIIPVFGDVHYALIPDERSLYARAQFGYGFFLFQGSTNAAVEQGGLLWAPSLGYHFKSTRKCNFYIESGLRLQNAYYEINEGSTQSQFDLTYKRISLKIGLHF